jgi:hypothetical protein
MYAIFAQISDPYGLFPPIGPRRVLIALALIFLYIGFMPPVWIGKIFRF